MPKDAQAANGEAQAAEEEQHEEQVDEAQAAEDTETQSGTVDELPEWAQSLIGNLRKENAGHRKAKQEAEAQAAKAEEERLAEQQQWQQLAEKRQARITELEPQAELAARYEEMVLAHVEAETKEWPEEVQALIPDDADTLAVLDAVKRARPLAKKLAEADAPPAGNGRGPKPSARAGKGEQEKELQAEARRFVTRNF